METRTHIRFRSARVNFKEGREERKKASVSQPIEARRSIFGQQTIDRSISRNEKEGKFLPHLDPIRQVKSGTGEDRCHGGQCRPQRAQHCHLIGRFESFSLSSRCLSAARFLADVSLLSPLFFSPRHSRIASEFAIQLSKPGSPTFPPPLPPPLARFTKN